MKAEPPDYDDPSAPCRLTGSSIPAKIEILAAPAA
jgi:hypothetical protein